MNTSPQLSHCLKQPLGAFVIGILVLGAVATPSKAVSPSISPWETILSSDSKEGAERDFPAQATVSGNTVHLLWTSSIGYDLHHLCYRRSIDGGATWQDRVILQDYPYNNWTTMMTGDTTRLAVDGANVHVIQLRYVDGWHYEIDYFRSTNGGTTFEPKRTIASSENAWIIDVPRIAAGDGKVAVAYGYRPNWYSHPSGHLILSGDNGATFTESLVLDDAYAPYDWNSGSIACSDIRREGDKILSLWRTNGSTRYLAVTSTNGGMTFSTTALSSLVTETWNTNPDSMRPQSCAITGGIMHVAWNQRNASGRSALFYTRSLDGGATFQTARDVSEGTIGTDEVRGGRFLMAALGTRVYVCYVANTGGGVWLRASSDSGAGFGAAVPLHLPGTSTAGNGEWPSLAIDTNDASGTKACVAFAVPSAYGGCSSSVIRHTYDGGNTFSPVLLPAHPWTWGNGHPDNFNLLPVASPAGTVWSMTYKGTRPGFDSDLFFRRFAPEPAPLAGNKVLRLAGLDSSQRYDMLEVPSVPSLQFSKQVTAEIWVNPTAATPLANGSQEILQWGESEPRNLSFRTYGGTVRDVSARILTTTGGYTIGGANPIGDGRWHHLALTYDADAGPFNLRFYLDGHLDSSVTATGTFVPSPQPLMVGGASLGWGISSFDGAVDNLRLWNRALTESEIRASARKHDLTGTEAGLAAAFGFDGTARDLSGNGADGLLQFGANYQASDSVPAPLMAEWSDNFSSKSLRPLYWRTNPNALLYKVNASYESVRVSKAAGGTGVEKEWFTMDSVWRAEGDFDVSVDFRNASLTRSTGSGNQLGITCTIGTTRYSFIRGDEKDIGQNIHIGIAPSTWGAYGVRATTITSGNLRLIRRDSRFFSFIDGEFLYQDTCGTDPMSCRLELRNNGTPDAISAAFDNFRIAATSLKRSWSSTAEIDVQQPLGSSLVDGTSRKSFGTVMTGVTGSPKYFTITNTGATSLSGLAITKTGVSAADFIVTAPARTSLPPGTSTTFKVTFKPTATGNRYAGIHIRSNDANENPFDIQLSGFGANP